MSRKHNTRHEERGRSRYRLRLSKRGLTKAPTMTRFRSHDPGEPVRRRGQRSHRARANRYDPAT